MPKFECTLRQDAWICHLCTIEAADAVEAAKLARQAWKTGNPEVAFTEIGHDGFDDAVMVTAEDCEELDEEGNMKGNDNA